MTGLEKIRKTRGLAIRIARECAISPAAVSKWARIPAERVLVIERLSGIPRHELRPDLYPQETA